MCVSFELRVFGGAVLLGPEGPVQGRAAHRRRLALLAILAASPGRTIGRERILGYLWPDQPADAGRHQLSEALYVLRKAVGEGAFVTAGDEVGLNPDVIGTDVAAFRCAIAEGRFRDAVEVYPGPFLDGFYVSDAPDFERWVEEERSFLADAYGSALEALAEGCEREGDHAGAAGWWRRRAAHDPYSSRVALRLMNALAAAGERAGALKHAAAHGAFLREELGVDPDPEVAEAMYRLAGETAALPRLEPRAEPPEPAQAEEFDPPDADGGADRIEPRDSSGGADAEGPEVPASAPSASGSAGPDLTPHGSGWTGRFLARFVGYVGAAMLGALFIVAALRLLPSLRAGAERQEELDPRRIAVLYFDDHSAEQNLGYLAGGLTEGLIRELSAVPALDVISRGGVKPYRQHPAPTDSIARRLRVGSIVEGSVQAWRDRLRVSVHLVDGATGRQLESHTVERPVGDLFAIQDELARHVSRFLRRRLGQEVRLRERERGTNSAAAMELVLRAEQLRQDARQVGASAHGRDSASARLLLTEADSLLAAAEALDRRWVEPPLLRGWTMLERSRLVDKDGAVRDLAAGVRHTDRVLELRPRHASALELRGTLNWLHVVVAPGSEGNQARLAAAEADLRAALREDPSQATAWATLSQFLRFRGDIAEADRAAARALEVDAYLDDAPRIVERLYRSALAVPDYAQARRWCARGRQDFPEDWRFVECQLVLLARDSSVAPDVRRAQALLGAAEVLDPAEKARRENRGYTPIHRQMVYATILARARLADSARATLERARAAVPPQPETLASFHYDEAHVWLTLGNRSEAARALRQVTEHRPHLREYLMRDPLFQRVMPPFAPHRLE